MRRSIYFSPTLSQHFFPNFGKIITVENKNLTASRPPEHPLVRGKMSKRLGYLLLYSYTVPGLLHEVFLPFLPLSSTIRRPFIYTFNRHWVSPEFIGSRICVPLAFYSSYTSRNTTTTSTRFSLGVELARDGTTEPISRDQIFKREWGKGKKMTTSRIGNPTNIQIVFRYILLANTLVRERQYRYINYCSTRAVFTR